MGVEMAEHSEFEHMWGEREQVLPDALDISISMEDIYRRVF
jgi:hypothetical protein